MSTPWWESATGEVVVLVLLTLMVVVHLSIHHAPPFRVPGSAGAVLIRLTLGERHRWDCEARHYHSPGRRFKPHGHQSWQGIYGRELGELVGETRSGPGGRWLILCTFTSLLFFPPLLALSRCRQFLRRGLAQQPASPRLTTKSPCPSPSTFSEDTILILSWRWTRETRRVFIS